MFLGEGESEPDAVPPLRQTDLSGVGLMEVAGASPLVKTSNLAKMKHNRFGRALPPMVGPFSQSYQSGNSFLLSPSCNSFLNSRVCLVLLPGDPAGALVPLRVWRRTHILQSGWLEHEEGSGSIWQGLPRRGFQRLARQVVASGCSSWCVLPRGARSPDLRHSPVHGGFLHGGSGVDSWPESS